jgi:hypothetical protein
MTHWTVQCSYAAYYTNTVTVEAETLEAALGLAIEKANECPSWSASDYCGPTHIDAVAQGEDVDLWLEAIDAQLPIPDRFTERGPVPHIIVTIEGGLGADVQISNGPATVEIRDYDIQGMAADRLTLDPEKRLCCVRVFPETQPPHSSYSEMEQPSCNS